MNEQDHYQMFLLKTHHSFNTTTRDTCITDLRILSALHIINFVTENMQLNK
jgi:hypothetical protein